MTRIPDLERQLVAAADRRRHRRRPALRGRSLAITAAAALAACGVAVAATTVLEREPPTPEAVEAYQPRGPVAFVSAVDVPDGPPWVLRSWGHRGGDLCIQPGRRVGDRFGLLFRGNPEGRRFAPLLYTDGPACGSGTVQAVHLLDRLGAPGAQLAATLVYGLVPDGAADGDVRLTVNGAQRSVAQSKQGAYLAVLDGDVPRSALRVTLSTSGGERELADFGRQDHPVAGAMIVNTQDVTGDTGLPWAQRVWTRADGARCALTGQLVGALIGGLVAGLPGAFVEAPSDEAHCGVPPEVGRDSTFHLRTQPLDPNVTASGPTDGFLVVEGLAAPDVQAVRIVTPDGRSQSAALDRRTRHLLGVVTLELTDPYAKDVPDRFSGKTIVEFRLDDGQLKQRALTQTP